MGVIFVSGIYGVGKTTICDKLNLEIGIPHYSASDLITKYVGELYGANKAVSNVDKNQENLINAVNDILKTSTTVLLSGHFCIFDKECNVVVLPRYVYQNLNIEKIILLENDLDTIICNLNLRDNKNYPIEAIENLQKNEREMSLKTSELLKVPFENYTLNYNDGDLANLTNMIIGG